MGAKTSKGAIDNSAKSFITPDFTFSSGFITGILITIIFLVLSWFLGTVNEKASEFYSGMMCKFVE